MGYQRAAPALELLIADVRKGAAQLQKYVESTKHQCLCGKTFATMEPYNDHRSVCPLLRVAIIGDIVRVSLLLGHTPTTDDYNRLRLSELPSISTFTTQLGVFHRWNDAIREAGLTPNRKSGNEIIN